MFVAFLLTQASLSTLKSQHIIYVVFVAWEPSETDRGDGCLGFRFSSLARRSGRRPSCVAVDGPCAKKNGARLDVARRTARARFAVDRQWCRNGVCDFESEVVAAALRQFDGSKRTNCAMLMTSPVRC